MNYTRDIRRRFMARRGQVRISTEVFFVKNFLIRIILMRILDVGI